MYSSECRNIRNRICQLANNAGQNGAHIGSSLSIVEIIFSICHLDYELILSKGHGALGMYAVLEHFDSISSEELDNFNSNGEKYYCHAVKDGNKINFSGGSLGLGLSYSIGRALVEKDKIFAVIIGDGELDEGLCWEGLNFLSQNPLPNLKVIVDRNHLQSDGYKDEIISVKTLEKKLTGWNMDLFLADGHNTEQVIEILSIQTSKTQILIADTVKGKGYEIFENDPKWHYGIVSDKIMEKL